MRKYNCPKLVKNSIIPAIALLLLGPSLALAATDSTINFQGKIVRNDTGYEGLNVTAGNPACVVAGNSNDTCDFQVQYFSASSGGTVLLTEDFANVEIGQYNGAFTLSLGSDSTPTAGTYSTLEEMVKAVSDLYIELSFAPGGAGSFTETFSRMPIQASAYALKAKYASGANTAFQFDTAADDSGYTSPSAGMVYYDTTDDELKVYDGSTWGSLGGGTGSLFTDGGIFTYLTALTDHFVLGADSYTAIGSDTYSTYLSGLTSRAPLSFDMVAKRLTLTGNQAQSGLTVYSSYNSSGAWPVATIKAEGSNFDNVVLQLVQDGTGHILSLQKGSTEAFAFENPLTFYMHPRTDSPTVTENRLYNVNGTLYWNGSALGGGSDLWTDGGTFTYLASTTDNLALGGNSSSTSKFYFDVSSGVLSIGAPGFGLDIASSSLISNTAGDITISPDEAVVIKANDTAGDNLMEWQDSSSTILSLINQSGYAVFGSGTANTSAMLTLGASTGTVAQINLASGLDVAAPNTGDMWWNGTNLYFFDGSTSVDLLTAGGGGSEVLSSFGTVSNTGYLNVAHDTNSYSVVANGWICVDGSSNESCSGGKWKNITEADYTISHSLSNQWNDADSDGIIRSIVKLTNIELAPGINVGTGADGAITVASSTSINAAPSLITGRSCADGGDAVNYNITAFNVAGTEATLSSTPSSGCLNANDEVLIINLQGTTTAYTNTGNYETLRISSVVGTTVTFQTAKTKYYGDGASDDSNLGTINGTQRVMLQRVPNYTNVTVNSGVNFTPTAWNGSKGGVLFFRASGAVSVTGSVTASATGYRGGAAGLDNTSGGTGGESFCNVSVGSGGYLANGTNGVCGGGGGASGGASAYSGGTGSSSAGGAGGGGGSYTVNGSYWGGGGGAGGGHATAGTPGGGVNSGGSGGTNSSGNGGNSPAGASGAAGGGAGGTFGTTDKLLFGAGGGGGGAGANTNGGAGGTGGGIVYLSASSITISGGIAANGASGGVGGSGNGAGGGGGGGAGGSLYMFGNTLAIGTNLATSSGGSAGAAGTGGSSNYNGGAGGVGVTNVYYSNSYTGTTSSPTATYSSIGYYNYGIYNSPVISTPNAQSYDALRWDASLNTYGKISVQTRSGNTDDPTNITDSFVWSKYDNTIPSASDTTSTNGRLPMGTSGKGDEAGVCSPTIILDGSTYKMWYIGYNGDWSNSSVYYATSTDGITWTKYDNTIPSTSDTTGTNGRLPVGTSGKGDADGITSVNVIKDGSTYKMWYTGYSGSTPRIYYATSSDGLTWTKYDNTIPSASDTTSTNGRIPLGTSGKGDDKWVFGANVIKDGSTYKMWYTGYQGLRFAIYYATSSDGLTWTKYNNTYPSASDTTGTNGQVPYGNTGKGDTNGALSPAVIYDGVQYRMWYKGSILGSRILYATSSDGLTWTKYDNSMPTDSDTTTTNGRIAEGLAGRGDEEEVGAATVLQDGNNYRVWYEGYDSSDTYYCIYYATGVEITGEWEEWRPFESGTNYTTLESADTHTNWTGTNATVSEGDIGRDIDYFEDEDETTTTNITKMTSSTNGGYAEATISATNISNYDYLTLWVRASQTGNVLRIGMGESAATEQYEDITIDTGNVWQKVYWDLSDISASSRDAITKIRLTNYSTSSNTIYLDNVRAEKLLSDGSGDPVASTPNNYFQYRVIFTTTNLSYQPQLENISLAYNSGYRIVMYDANNTRLYNYSGISQYLRLDVVASTGGGSSGGGGFINGLAVSNVADGEDAIAFQFDTSVTFSDPTSKLLSVLNNGTEMMYLDADGNLYVAGTITSGSGFAVALTNNSGGTITTRSLVTVDTTANNSFTTTTIAGMQGAMGVVQGVKVGGDTDGDGNCDSGDTCLVVFEGTTNVNLDNAASSSRGDYIYTSTTAGSGHAAASTEQTNGLIGVVTSIANAGSGYVQMVFDAQNKITADLYLNINIGLDKSAYRDMYNQLANDYASMTDAERRGVVESGQSQSIMFDSFVDSLKMDSTNSDIGVDGDSQRAGLWGGLTIDGTTTDIAGNRYLGSSTATLLVSKYYDRSQTGLQDQDSTAETLVDLGIDPNWYNGVSLQTATNLSTFYNGSLITVSGMYGTGSEHGYLDIVVTGTTVSGITANITSSDGSCSATGASLTFGSNYSFTTGSCSSSTITIKPVRGDYNSGDRFRIASWYLEPTTSDDRGSERVFPVRSLIVASADASYTYVTIVNADTQRVWMKFASNSSGYASGNMLVNNTSRAISAIDMINGQLVIGANSSNSAEAGYMDINFVSDSAQSVHTTGTWKFNGNISSRNTASAYTLSNSNMALVSNIVNDVSSNVVWNKPTQETTVSGWGYIQGNDTAFISEVANFPYIFDIVPNVVMTAVGQRASAPSSLSECNSFGNNFEAFPLAPTKKGVTAYLNSNAVFGSSNYYCYTWTATGTVSPRQFVAVATGDTGVDGGVTVINKTDQISTNYLIGSLSAAVGWQNKVVLDTKGNLYVASNSDTGNNTTVSVYNNVLTRPSDTTWATYRSGYYQVGSASAGWSINGVSILGNNLTNQIKSLYVQEGASSLDGISNTIYVGTSLGVSVIQEKKSGNATLADGLDERNGSVKYYTKDYISEQMVGDVRGMWPLTSSYGSGLSDASIKAATLTNNGTVTFGTGVRGQAAVFNGSSYLSCTDANCGGTTKLDYPGTGGWSMSAWIKPTDVTATYSIITKWQGGGTGFSYLFRLINKELSFISSTDGATVSSTISTASSPISTNGQWYHVTVVYVPSTSVSFYVNGDLVSQTTASVPSTIFNGTGVFDIGAHDASINPFVGSIDEPMVTATSLTSAQIKGIYEDGLRALKGSHSSADTYNQLSGTSNDVRDILVTPDSKYMYVGTEGGGISKIDLTSSTRVNTYTTSTDPSTSTNNVETLSGRYYPVLAGDIGSSGRLMGIDSDGNDSSGTYYSRTVSFDTATNRAYLWMSAYIDSSDPSSSITVSASNDDGDTYVTGTLVKTNTNGLIPEYEYSFTFPSSDKDYKVKFEIARGSSNKASTYVTGWGLAQMELSDGTVNGLFTQTGNTVANGDYLEVVHGQNTYNLVTNGWVFDEDLDRWVEISNNDNGVTQNLSNQWNDADSDGIIRTLVKLTDVELAPGVDVGTGADGAITVSSNTNINTTNLITGRTCADGGDAVNYSITAFNAAGTEATLSTTPSTGCLNVNDEVLVINLQGTSANYANVGNYETLRVQSISSSTITFTNAKAKFYGNNVGDDSNIGTGTSNQRVMLQRIPNYNNVTVNSGVTFSPSAWNGAKGGVMFFRAMGSVSVSGSISAYALGYRGGAGGPANNMTNGYSGEGTNSQSISSAGANVGGGSAGFYNTAPYGGGGGSHSSLASGGGGSAYGIASLTKLYLGSGGGGGGTWVDSSGSGYGGAGGYGGGIIAISANSISVSGAISSNGASGAAGVTHGSGGGGGAGGSIRLDANIVTLGTSLVTSNAGAGATGYNGRNGYAGSTGRIAVYYSNSVAGSTSPTYNDTTVGYYNYGIYNSPVISTPNAQSYDALKWDSSLNTYGKISVQTRSGATTDPTDGTWEEWRPYTSGTNYTTLQSADTHTDFTGTNATVSEGDIGRNVDYFEDEDEVTTTDITKAVSSTNGGYLESTIAAANLTSYDYVTMWVYAGQAGNTLRLGMGESAGTEQYEDITIDTANVWQKVYWDISDITSTSRDAITKIRVTNFSTSSNTFYIDNIKGEKLLSTGSGSPVESTPNDYFQYRVIFTTTNLSYQPQLENISFTYSTGFRVQIMDANTVRLYNNSGNTQKLKLDIILGSAAIDLTGSQYALNIAPSSAQIDGGNNTNSIWINKLGTGGNLLRLQTNSVDMLVLSADGNMDLAGDMAVLGGSISLGESGDQGTIRYNATTDQIEFSNDGTNWMPLGDNTRLIALSAEYAGAVLSGDGSDNVGTMTSDNTGSSSNSMNYYEWSSSALTLNDYDVRVRFKLPSDFNGWGSGGITLNLATESTSDTNNKVDAYVYLEGSATVDGSATAQVSSSAGVWTTATIAGTDLDECDAAGETCVIILRMSSLGDNYVRIGDIDITYNRSL